MCPTQSTEPPARAFAFHDLPDASTGVVVDANRRDSRRIAYLDANLDPDFRRMCGKLFAKAPTLLTLARGAINAPAGRPLEIALRELQDLVHELEVIGW